MIDKIFKKRRSIRKYTDQKISKDDLEKIMQSVFYAPTGRNENDIELIGVLDRDKLDELSTYKKGASMLKGATAAIAVLSDKEVSPRMNRQDACIAASYILLKATDMGIATCWLNVCTSDEEDIKRLHRILAVPDKYNIETVISMGYAAEEKGEKKARDMEGRIHWNQM